MLLVNFITIFYYLIMAKTTIKYMKSVYIRLSELRKHRPIKGVQIGAIYREFYQRTPVIEILEISTLTAVPVARLPSCM